MQASGAAVLPADVLNDILDRAMPFNSNHPYIARGKLRVAPLVCKSWCDSVKPPAQLTLRLGRDHEFTSPEDAAASLKSMAGWLSRARRGQELQELNVKVDGRGVRRIRRGSPLLEALLGASADMHTPSPLRLRMQQWQQRLAGGHRVQPFPTAPALSLPNLVKLDLSCLGQGLSDAQVLADRLPIVAPQLQELLLHGCNLGNIGTTVLASAVGGLTKLHTLHISSNGIGQAGARALAAGLPTLTCLDVSYNPLGSEGVAALGQLHRLERLNVTGCNMGAAGEVVPVDLWVGARVRVCHGVIWPPPCARQYFGLLRHCMSAEWWWP